MMESTSGINTSIGHIHQIIVVGGGTAGWLTASHLAKKLCSRHESAIQVTLIESPDIPTIGVGEGTVPAMRKTLQYLGISETDFIRTCDATFKQSIKFVDWEKSPGTHKGKNFYHHLFDFPYIQPFDLTPYWLLGDGANSYARDMSIQEYICEEGLGPKKMTHAEFEGSVHYAYHLDAVKFAALLSAHAVNNLGVKHVLARVDKACLDSRGNIEKVLTDAGEFTADFFVDCTGFSAMLIGDQLGVPFIPKTNCLFADYAVAAQIPYADATSPIPSFTISTAKEAGWIWDIGLTQRRGTGYVYSSQHTTHERAEQVLRDYVNQPDVNCRRIAMQVGYREKFWVNNCAAVGLSQGFVEPLEATGLLVYDATARMLADLFPATFEEIPRAAQQFNECTRNAWDKVIDFVKLHYFISKRDDTDFWIDNREAANVSDTLLARLEAWRYQVPSDYDFSSRMEIFNLENYLYVLYGMNYPTKLDARKSRYLEAEKAKKIVQRLHQEACTEASQLLPHRELIERIKRYGLQKY